MPPVSNEDPLITRIILGMHRSGTSALAGALAAMGYDLGTDLVPSGPDNPKGFYEQRQIVVRTDTLLRSLGSDWRDLLPLPANWVHSSAAIKYVATVKPLFENLGNDTGRALKDPRLCRVFPLWREAGLLPENDCCVLHCVRDPLEVASSLHARDGMSLRYGLSLWLRYNTDAVLASEGYHRTVVVYPDFMRDIRQLMVAVSGSDQKLLPDDNRERAIVSFLEPRLWRQRRDPSLRYDDPIYDLCLQVFAQLKSSDATVSAELLAQAQKILLSVAPSLQREYATLGYDVAALSEEENAFLRIKSSKQEKEISLIKENIKELQSENGGLRDENRYLHMEKDALEEQCARTDRLNQYLAAEKERIDRALMDKSQEADSLYHQLRWVESERDRLFQSRSWKITAPLRGLAQGIRIGRRPQREDSSAASVAAEAERVEIHPGVFRTKSQVPTRYPDKVERSPHGPRILIASLDIVGPIRNGGIGTAFTSLALFYARSGCTVDILYTLGNHTEHWAMEDCIQFYAHGGVKLIPLLPTPDEEKIDAPWPRRNSYRVYQWIKNLAVPYDVIIFPDWRGEGYYTALAKHQGLLPKETKVWVNTHGPSCWSMEGNYQLPDSREMVELDFLERETVRLADWVISPSRYLLEWMDQHGWQRDGKETVIQNLFWEASTNATSVETAVERVQIHELVFFGRLEPRKGIILFAQALQRIPDAILHQIRKITFLGKALSPDVFDSLGFVQTAIAPLGVPIEIHTDWDRDAALAYLMDAPGRLAIMPSLVENLPYTVFECIYHRIPFVATNIGGIPELILAEDRDACLFDPRPQAFGKLLARVLVDGISIPRQAVSASGSQQAFLDLLPGIGTQEVVVQTHSPLQQEDPLVTVCIAHYERPRRLRAALESLQKQSYQNVEVVVVDDGSESASTLRELEQLAAEMQQRGWRLLRQENAYPGEARNFAAKEARGSYLLFMDDDNLAQREELKILVAVAQKTQADVLTMVSAVFSGDAPGAVADSYWLPLGPAAGVGLYQNAFGDTNSLWRREAFLELGGFTTDYGLGHEDWELFSRAVLSGLHLELVPEPLFWYRSSADGIQGGGNSLNYHARSVRPYLEVNPAGLGLVAAHALARELGNTREDLPLRDFFFRGTKKLKYTQTTRLVKLLKKPHLRRKFYLYVRRDGLRATLHRSLQYLRRRT